MDVGNRLVEVELDARGTAGPERLRRAGGGDRPGVRVVEHLADRRPQQGARPAHGDVADELLPDQLLHVVERPDVEARLAPGVRGRLDSRRGRAATLAEPDELEPVVVDVPRPDDRRAEPARHADRDAVAEDTSRQVGPAEAVLDREHKRVRADQRSGRLGGGLDVHRFRREDDEVSLARLRRVGGCVDPHRAISARALDPQPVVADRVDVLLPEVDRPQLVPGIAEQPRVDGAHCANTDDGDLHGCDDREMERVALYWQSA